MDMRRVSIIVLILYSLLNPYVKSIFTDCETVGYLYLAVVVFSAVIFYNTYKHRSMLVLYNKEGNLSRSEQELCISNKIIIGHVLITLIVIILTIGLTTGYLVACDNISAVIKDKMKKKLNKDPNVLRGEKIDERFIDDNQFWRYTGAISNPFGQEHSWLFRVFIRLLKNRKPQQ